MIPYRDLDEVFEVYKEKDTSLLQPTNPHG
jgi:hypothetical protein